MEEGAKFPSFSLPDQDGETCTLKDLTGDRGLVLYAYPKDDTPGCTIEAKDFRDLLGEYEDEGYRVAGISKDPAESHQDFRDKYGLTFTLLTDAEGEFLEAIGAWGEKTMYGRTSEGIKRSTFVIGKDGTLLKHYPNVRANGHAERVLADVRKL
jgi:peroxiredoxin Q/BCP